MSFLLVLCAEYLHTAETEESPRPYQSPLTASPVRLMTLGMLCNASSGPREASSDSGYTLSCNGPCSEQLSWTFCPLFHYCHLQLLHFSD